MAGGEDGDSAHARAALTAAAETEIDGLRPHREGAPASRIHWPALARGAGLMERKLISEADSRPLVVLDPRAPESPEALDAAVRAAASLVVHFAKRGGCGLLLPGDRRAHVIERDMLAWPQAHVRLALVEEHTGPALTAAQNRRGVIAYVAARTVDRVPRGLGRTPGGCLLVIPGALPNRRAVIEVAGCQGYVAARTGSAALMATVGAGDDMSAGVSALRGPAPALRSATPDERRPDARAAPDRAAAAVRVRPRRHLPRARDVRRAALDGDARADRRRARLVRGRHRPRWRWPGCSARRGSHGALRWLAVAAVTRRRARARLPRRRHRRRAAAARQLGRAGRGHHARHRRAARRARALPRHRRVDAARDPARRHDPDRGRRARSRSGRGARRVGFPLVALILLVTLYAVPAVALDFEGEFLRGALLALLVLAFLRLERLRLTEARRRPPCSPPGPRSRR